MLSRGQSQAISIYRRLSRSLHMHKTLFTMCWSFIMFYSQADIAPSTHAQNIIYTVVRALRLDHIWFSGGYRVLYNVQDVSKRVPVCKTNTFGRKVRRRREKIETRAKITVSDVKNMENIAKFTKNVYKNRAEGAIFFGDLVKSVKSLPFFLGSQQQGGAFY